MPADTGSDIGHILQDIVSYNAGPGWIGSHLNGVDPPDEIQPKERQIFRCFRQGIPEDTPVMVRGWGAIYDRRDRARAQWSEEFRAEYIEAVIRAVSEGGWGRWNFMPKVKRFPESSVRRRRRDSRTTFHPVP